MVHEFFTSFILSIIVVIPAALSIFGPLEVRVGGTLSVVCGIEQSPSLPAADIILTQGERHIDYINANIGSSSNGTHKEFFIGNIQQEDNGTLLSCSFSEFNSRLLPILVLSKLTFFVGGGEVGWRDEMYVKI